MSMPYFTEEAKLCNPEFPKWTGKQCTRMEEILREKGYNIMTCSRIGCDMKYHDAWQVNRKDIPRLIEQLFRQRIVVEVQAEGHGKASINFCYDYHAKHILGVVSRFQRNKEVAQ